MNLSGFIESFQNAICAAVVKAFPPVYDAAARADGRYDLRLLLRRPLGGQADAIRAAALSLHLHRGTILVGEQGSGKSYLAAAAAYLAGFDRVLVMAPPHLVRKWQREIRQTVPCARTAIVRSMTDLERVTGGAMGRRQALRSFNGRNGPAPPRAPFYVICSRERAKLGYRWLPAAVGRLARDEDGLPVRDERGGLVRVLCCPACFAPLLDDEEIAVEWADLAERRRKCPQCSSPLWCADRTGPRRFPLADYIHRRLPGYFQLLIADEVHELKGRGSAQGLAAASLAGTCEKTLALTGTVFGGYASTLFHLLRRFSPSVAAEFRHDQEALWVSRYGIVHRITKRNPDAYTEDGRHSKRRNYTTRIVEKPGVAPSVLFHLLPNSIFLRLADVARDLPPYTERVILYPLDTTDHGGVSQAAAYAKLAGELRRAVQDALGRGSKRLLAAYLQTLLAYPDGCTREETVLDRKTGNVIGAAPALPEDVLYPKERALVDLAKRERARGRRLVVYLANTDKRDLTPRLRTILEAEGFRVAVLKATTVNPERREEWLAKQVEDGAQILLCHPKLVQTGLDLLDWHSYTFYQVEYSTYVLRQAARRGWRIGQRQPVEVYHFAYEGTLQAEALALIAAKLRAAVLLDGELPEDGLAAMEAGDEDLFLALAKRLTESDAVQTESLEALFAQAQRSEAEAGELLVEDGWHAAGAIAPASAAVAAAAAADSWSDGADEWITTAVPPAGRDITLRPVAQLGLQLEGGVSPASPSAPGAQASRPLTAGRVLTFGELERLVTRPKSRSRPVPAGQLSLFDDGLAGAT